MLLIRGKYGKLGCFIVLGMIMQAQLFEDKQTKQLYSIIGYEDGTVALWDVDKCVMRSRIKTHAEAGMENFNSSFIYLRVPASLLLLRFFTFLISDPARIQ